MVYYWERSSCYLSCTIIYQKNLTHYVYLILSEQQEIVASQSARGMSATDRHLSHICVMVTLQDLPAKTCYESLAIASKVDGQLCPFCYVGPCLQWEWRSWRGQFLASIIIMLKIWSCVLGGPGSHMGHGVLERKSKWWILACSPNLHSPPQLTFLLVMAWGGKGEVYIYLKGRSNKPILSHP